MKDAKSIGNEQKKIEVETNVIKIWECEDCGLIVKSSKRPKSCSCGKKYWYNRECKDEDLTICNKSNCMTKTLWIENLFYKRRCGKCGDAK